MQYVIFKLAGEEFGISVDDIREVIKVPSISYLPGVPDFIEGVITIRKHSVMVMDLYKRLNVVGSAKKENNFVLIVAIEGMIVGLLVDEVSEILDVSDVEIDSAGMVAHSYLDGNSISGIAHVGDRAIIILNIGQILKSQEINELGSFDRFL